MVYVCVATFLSFHDTMDMMGTGLCMEPVGIRGHSFQQVHDRAYGHMLHGLSFAPMQVAPCPQEPYACSHRTVPSDGGALDYNPPGLRLCPCQHALVHAVSAPEDASYVCHATRHIAWVADVKCAASVSHASVLTRSLRRASAASSAPVSGRLLRSVASHCCPSWMRLWPQK